MRRVTLEDIVGLERYGKVRDDFRRRIIQLKRSRRLAVGDSVTFVFENFDTVLFQVQEMLLVEKISDIDRVREEIEVYNALIPGPGELSATMLIEIVDAEKVVSELQRLIGIDEHVTLEIGEHRVAGVFEEGRSKEDKLSAVQYVRFRLDDSARRAFAGADVASRLVIDHPNYRTAAAIEGAVRESLRADLTSK